MSLAEVAKRMGVSLDEAAKLVRRLEECGLVSYTHYFIYEPERAHSVNIPVHRLRELCNFIRRKIALVSRVNPEKAEKLREEYLPQLCLIV